jgi:hyaluronoglucosaminidase
MTGFGIRGVIEGFYGPPWSWEDRLRLVPFLAAHGLTTYAYAPKNDPLHRDRWREPYLREDWRRFADLTRRCAEAGVDVVFGVSPLGFGFARGEPDAADLDRLVAKFAAADAIGVRTFCLLVDDMPDRSTGDASEGPATADVRLVRRVNEAVTAFGPGRRLWFVPQPYCGDPDTPYLRQLGAQLPPQIEICWTGPQVCSAEVRLAHARAIGASLRRPALLWDNHPANDGGMRDDPHLGPLRGRDPRLPEAMAGIVANLSLQPEASRIAVATVGDYATAPDGYVPDVSWRRALEAVAGNAAAAVSALADVACRSPLEPGRRDNALTPAIAAFWAAWHDVRRRPAALDEIARGVALLAGHAERLTGALANRRLRDDLSPWSRKLAHLMAATALAVEVLRAPGGADARRHAVLEHLDAARRTSHWVGGELFDEFARACLHAADAGEVPPHIAARAGDAHRRSPRTRG